jgi:hypothetical protein
MMLTAHPLMRRSNLDAVFCKESQWVTVEDFAIPSTHLDGEIIDGALTLLRFYPLISSLQCSNPGAKQGDLFFLLLQLDPLFFDFFVGNTLPVEKRRVSGRHGITTEGD